MITALYAGLAGILFLILSVNVIRKRRSLQVAIGDDGQPELTRAVRAHGNFSEYVPICVLLMLLLESQAFAPGWLIHVLGLSLLVGRGFHAYGVSQVKENLRFRVAGMVMTFTLLILMSLMLIMRFVLLQIAG